MQKSFADWKRVLIFVETKTNRYEKFNRIHKQQNC
jgi:hypothetical protein